MHPLQDICNRRKQNLLQYSLCDYLKRDDVGGAGGQAEDGHYVLVGGPDHRQLHPVPRLVLGVPGDQPPHADAADVIRLARMARHYQVLAPRLDTFHA